MVTGKGKENWAWEEHWNGDQWVQLGLCHYLQPRQAVRGSSVRGGCQDAMCIPGSLGASPSYLPGWGRDHGCQPWKPTQACVAHHMRLSGILLEARLAGNQGSTAWEGPLRDRLSPSLQWDCKEAVVGDWSSHWCPGHRGPGALIDILVSISCLFRPVMPSAGPTPAQEAESTVRTQESALPLQPPQVWLAACLPNSPLPFPKPCCSWCADLQNC